MKIKGVIDVEIVDIGGRVYLVVLHMGDIEKVVGTNSKQNINQLSIYEF